MADYPPPERIEWERNLVFLADMLVTEYGLPTVADASKNFPVSFIYPYWFLDFWIVDCPENVGAIREQSPLFLRLSS